MISNLALGLEYAQEYDPRVRDELDQLTGSIQVGFNNLGKWKQLGLNDVSFYGSGGATWTVETADANDAYAGLAYCLIGTTMLLSVAVINTTIGGTAGNVLYMTLPAPFTAVRGMWSTALIVNNAPFTFTAGIMRVRPGGQRVEFIKGDVTNFAASTNNTHVVGQMAIEVQ